jgi:O-antigen ligase
MPKLILIALLILATGLLTSISLMAGFHILIFPAILGCWRKYDWKKFPKSGWALLALSLVLIVSVLANYSLVEKPFKSIFKVKYYVFGLFSIIPLDFYFNQYLNREKKQKVLKILLWVLLISSALATVSGLVGYFTGYNPLRLTHVDSNRNGGLFGMVMTYGHSMSWLAVLLVSVCANGKCVQNLVPRVPLLGFTALALTGLYTSHVRGAWLSFLAGSAWINKRITVGLLCLCLFTVGVVSYRHPDFIEKQIIRRGSNEERVGSWLGAIKAFEERPWLGYGFLNYEPFSREIKSRYHLPHADFGGHAHNDFLEILATSGLLGAICFVLWFGFWANEMWRKKGLFRDLVFPFIVAVVVSGFTQVTFSDGENTFFLMIVYALSQVLTLD